MVNISKAEHRLRKIEKNVEEISMKLDKHLEESNILIKEFKDNTIIATKHAVNIDLSLCELHKKMDSVVNVSVNGTVGLENSLRTLYDATASKRKWTRLKSAGKDWLDTKPVIGKFVRSKIGKFVIIAFYLFLIMGVLNLFGIIDVTPVDILKWALKFYLTN